MKFLLPVRLVVVALICFLYSSNAIRTLRSSNVVSKGKSVTFDGRSFFVDGQRKMLVSGSVHYPRLPQSEWSQVFSLLKESGINIIQTYVFWDIHEPSPGNYYFPNDSSPDNLVKFIRTAQKYGLYVNLRIGPYVCAEWNYGGLPVWLKKVKDADTGKTIVYRTNNEEWLDRMLAFSDQVLDLMSKERLFYADNGPIIMLQLENEYGNIEKSYGLNGKIYIEKLAAYIDTKRKQLSNLPWIMCQQGEGNGSNPPENIINTCNGYYCDNWISKHVEAFPNQPHMFTENWPGWFQNWGDPIPHRPAVDVAFSVARWYARGGSYMNYYMAFGGSTFGRHVGGPAIITSYDYDVQVNEYAMKAEPKYSLLSYLHQTILQYSDVMLNTPTIPDGVPLAGYSNCESHTYTDSSGCISFLSNYDTSKACSFPTAAGNVTVAPWSVNILAGASCGDLQEVYSTRDSIRKLSIPTSHLTTKSLTTIPFSSIYCEEVPHFATAVSSKDLDDGHHHHDDHHKKDKEDDEDRHGKHYKHDRRVLSHSKQHKKRSSSPTVVTSTYPMEQLEVTGDSSDYLWYSTVIPASSTERKDVPLSFVVANGGGSIVYLFLNGQRVGQYLPQEIKKDGVLREDFSADAVLKGSDRTKLTFTLTIPASTTDNEFSILAVTMGLQNYGAHLEDVFAGIVSNVSLDTEVLLDWKHTVGLAGEAQQLYASSSTTSKYTGSTCGTVQWFEGSFTTNSLLKGSSTNTIPSHLAIDIDNSGGLSKGAIWVNDFMLGRYWDIIAGTGASGLLCGDENSCASEVYTGSYNADRCRTGCGEMSQRLYKIPADILYPITSDKANRIVVTDETGKIDASATLSFTVVEVAMDYK